MAVPQAKRLSRLPRFQGTLRRIEVPRELIEVLAYEKFLARGGEHGHDVTDWLAAESELREVFSRVHWDVQEESSPPDLVLRAVGPRHAIDALCRYFQKCPTPSPAWDGPAALLRVIGFEDADQEGKAPLRRRKDSALKREKPAPGQSRRNNAARSPVSALSSERFAQLRGHLVALLLDGPEKGTVIAAAPLDLEHPDRPRQAIKAQVSESPYKNRRYQLRQILGDA